MSKKVIHPLLLVALVALILAACSVAAAVGYAADFKGVRPSLADALSGDAPSTEAPSTEASSIETSSTEAPSTEAPSTEAPSTEAPSTEAIPQSTTPWPTPTETPTPVPIPTNTWTPEPTQPPAPLPSPTPEADAPVAEPEPPNPTPTYPPPPASVDIPILMYHYISELPADADEYRRDLTVPPDRFEAQLRYLSEQGYQSVSLADVYETLSLGKPLPERPIVLTFDDGYKDAYTHVLPLLQTYGFTGEFFVLATPAHHEAPHYLTWSDMRTMAEAGLFIQAHGRDHFDLTNRSYDFLVYQILGAKEAVEAHTGQPVRFFCYPSGRYDEDTQSVVASAGYWGAVTTAWGTELRLDNRYAWPRVRIKGAWTVEHFAAVLASLEQQ